MATSTKNPYQPSRCECSSAPAKVNQNDPMSAKERVGTDPVCKMDLAARQIREWIVHNGRTYYFCSIGCRAEFQRHPEDYTTPAEPER